MTDPYNLLNKKISTFNMRQREALDSVLAGWNGPKGEFIFPIVEGPPGTGKTTVGVCSALKYMEENKKPQIAYLAYTNFAAEKAREDFYKLGFSKEEVIRVVPYREESNLKKGIIGCDPNFSNLSDEERRRLSNTPIMISTISSANRIFKTLRNPLVFIDEFSQVNPAMFFSIISQISTAVYKPSGFVLLGDPNQLPVISSQSLLRPNIGSFIFSRKRYEPHQLMEQYRMNETICDGINALREALLSYPLETPQDVKKKNLTGLGYLWNPGDCPSEFHDILAPENPFVIINTDNLPGMEEIGFGESKFYSSEAKLVSKLAISTVKSYKNSNRDPLYPVILSPYNAQIGVIRKYLGTAELQNCCTTIYKSQGKEYPFVIVSFTRKNLGGYIGLLQDPQFRPQAYVACSRAEAKLIILLSFNTFKGYSDYDYLLDRMENKALVVENAEPNWVS